MSKYEEQQLSVDLVLLAPQLQEELKYPSEYKYFQIKKLDEADIDETEINITSTQQVAIYENSNNVNEEKKSQEYLLKFGVVEDNVRSYHVKELSANIEIFLKSILRSENVKIIFMLDNTSCAFLNSEQQAAVLTDTHRIFMHQLISEGSKIRLEYSSCGNTSADSQFIDPTMAATDASKTIGNLKNEDFLENFVKRLESANSTDTDQQLHFQNDVEMGISDRILSISNNYITYDLKSFCEFYESKSEPKAKIERFNKSMMQLVIFQMTYYQRSSIFDLSTLSTNCFQQNSEMLNKFLTSLNGLYSMLDNSGFFSDLVNVELYALDLNSKQFAYKLQGKENKRAFVNFSFSFDVQDMLLPLGFMNSSKIALWQSDAPNVSKFVTTGSIATRPFSVSVALMD